MGLPARRYQSASIFSNGSAYSRQNPKSDHDPLANLLNFEDIGTDVEKAGTIIKQVLDGILNGIPAAILELTGLDFSSPEAFVTSLITVVTTGGPALVWAAALLDTIGQALGFPPGAFKQLMQFIPSLFGGLDLAHIGTLTPAAAWATVISTLIKPLNLLAPLNGFGFLPDANRPQLLQDTIDSVVDVFQTGTQGTSSGNNLATAFLSLLGIHRTGTGAVSQNVVQDSQIGSLLSGGSGLFDTFDGASATLLPTAKWEQTYTGSGGGTSGLSGSGVCTWRTSGSSVRGVLNRYKTALATDIQLISVTLNSNLPASTIANDPAIRLQGRMNSTHDTYVEARINFGQAEIGIVVSGTYTRLGANQSLSGDSSGTWSLKLGTVSSNREFVLLRNGVTVMTRSDSGATSGMGASYRYPGFGQVAGVQYLGGIIFLQMAPPDVESFGASDRLAAL